MRAQIGAISHFSIAVSDPEASALWWTTNFNLDERFRSGTRVGLANEFITIVLFPGKPNHDAPGHMAFRTPDVEMLVLNRDVLRERGVRLEDPGDEIGSVTAGSPNMGLWFHDIDGYRWEFYAQRHADDPLRTII